MNRVAATTGGRVGAGGGTKTVGMKGVMVGSAVMVGKGAVGDGVKVAVRGCVGRSRGTRVAVRVGVAIATAIMSAVRHPSRTIPVKQTRAKTLGNSGFTAAWLPCSLRNIA